MCCGRTQSWKLFQHVTLKPRGNFLFLVSTCFQMWCPINSCCFRRNVLHLRILINLNNVPLKQMNSNDLSAEHLELHSCQKEKWKIVGQSIVNVVPPSFKNYYKLQMTIYAEAVTLIEKQFFWEKHFTCCIQHSNLKIKFPNFPTYTISHGGY